MKNFILILLGIFISMTFHVEAQRIIENGSVTVTDPEGVFTKSSYSVFLTY